jgi:hypothetical protein
MLAGLALSMFGQMAAGSDAAQANLAAAVQARVAAVRRRLRASDDARIIEEQGNRFQANQAVGFAKSGVLLDQGSPLSTLMDTAINIERNAMRTRLAGEWDSGGLESQASAYDKMADNASKTGMYKAAGSFLSYSTAQQGAYKAPVSGAKTSTWGMTLD